jgi:hypothetical protein
MKILAIAPGTAAPGPHAGRYLSAYHDRLLALAEQHDVTVVLIDGTSRTWNEPGVAYGYRSVRDRHELSRALPSYDLVVRHPLASQAG